MKHITESEVTSPPGPESRGPRASILVVGAAVITVVLWASAFIGIRATGEFFDPGALALLRVAIGAVALTVVAVISGIRLPPRRHLPLIAAWGVGWFGIYNVALNAAELSIDAGTASMIVNIAPLIVIVISGFLLREGYPRGLMFGAPLAFIGVVLIGVESMAQGHLQVFGVLLAFLAAVLYAGGALAQKHLIGQVDSVTMTWLGAVAGTISLLPWTGQLVTDLQSAPASAVWGVVYLGIFPTAIAFTTWAYVLRRTSAGKTAATTYAVPALTVLMSWMLLGEVPTFLMLIGGALCLVGVMVTRIRRAPHQPNPQQLEGTPR